MEKVMKTNANGMEMIQDASFFNSGVPLSQD